MGERRDRLAGQADTVAGQAQLTDQIVIARSIAAKRSGDVDAALDCFALRTRNDDRAPGSDQCTAL
ncbi:hypothetical protein GCM10011329_00880 [Stakelama pacifica]|nr:hypothetical protein GCM10011329_00880 [Stakelama pacifica]